MDNSPEAINNLILDLSLASTLPVGMRGRDYIRASASANALVNRTKDMQPRELRELEYSIGPLLTMLLGDTDNPVAAKAAAGLRYLMPSRICMAQFMKQDGLIGMSKVLDELLGKNIIDLKSPSTQREVVEHLSVCYRELGRFYPWEIVKVGALRHSVILIRFGDIILQTSAAGTLAALSLDLNICKQMFVNGAIRPLLNICDAELTNPACMLAGLGCIVQLCNIPEIGIRVVMQGAIPVIEAALHRKVGHSSHSIREKALYAIAWLSRIPEVQSQLGTIVILRGMKRELKSGTMPSRYTVVQILLNIHGKYEAELRFLRRVIDRVMALLVVGPWHARNLCVKAVCVLYPEDKDKLYLVEHGFIENINALIKSKPADLQEAPMVAFLSLCTHRDLPFVLINKGCVEVVISIMCNAIDDVIRELAVILLKTFTLYNLDAVDLAMPADKAYLLQRDPDTVALVGSEYGELIEEYLHRIVENRRDMHYLLEQLTQTDLDQLGVPQKLLQSYQNTFMELDIACRGMLGIDELKMLVIMLGEVLDKEELKELLDEYGSHRKGSLDFKEFVTMMNDWETRFGKGATKILNEATKRGPIGRARRAFHKWWHRNEIEKLQVEEVKRKKAEDAQRLREMALQYQGHEKLQNERMLASREKKAVKRVAFA